MIRVNETEIDESEILNEMQYHEAASPEDAKYKAGEALVISELLQQQARKQGYDADIDQFVDELLEQEIKVSEASEEECRRYFENNRHKFHSSPLVEGRHILLGVPEADIEARSKALDQARQLIQCLQDAPERFAELALQHSRCPSAKTGGSLGQIGKGQTVPEFERQLFNCQEGLAGSPMESRYGVHVVWIDHIVPGQALPFEVVHRKISDYLSEKLRFKSIAHYIQSLANDARIEGFEVLAAGN